MERTDKKLNLKFGVEVGKTRKLSLPKTTRRRLVCFFLKKNNAKRNARTKDEETQTETFHKENLGKPERGLVEIHSDQLRWNLETGQSVTS